MVLPVGGGDLRNQRDRGDASVEAVIIVPVIVVLTLLVVQFVLVWHGTHVAQAAAQTAARTAAAYRADPGTGQAAGDAYLAEVAPNLLPGRTVTVTADADRGHRHRAGPGADDSAVRQLRHPGDRHRSPGAVRRNWRRAMTSRCRDRVTRVVPIGIVGR